MEVMAEVEHKNFNHSWIVESIPNMCCGLMVAHAVFSPKNGSVPLKELNPRNGEERNLNCSDGGSRRRSTC